MGCMLFVGTCFDGEQEGTDDEYVESQFPAGHSMYPRFVDSGDVKCITDG